MTASLDLLAESWQMDCQADSPLFNGTIPAEIRLEIFRYALTPSIDMFRFEREGGKRVLPHDPDHPLYPNEPETWLDYYWAHDFRLRRGHDDDPDSDLPADLSTLPEQHSYSQTILGVWRQNLPKRDYDTELSWCRPGCRGRPVLSFNLLASCRRAFVEARSFCFQSERHWWWWTGPWHPFPIKVDTFFEPEKRWYPPGVAGRALDSWSRERIEWEQRFPSARIFGHPGLPSDDYLFGHRHPPPFLKLQHLRITIPMSGMNGCFSEEEYVINPFGRQKHMKKAMRISRDFNLQRALKEGGPGSPDGRPAWMPPGLGFRLLRNDAEFQGPWGRKFVNLPEIRTLTIDFDIDQHYRAEMEEIVEWAKRTWQLPLNPNINGGYHYLSADGVEPDPDERTCWRGSQIHFERYKHDQYRRKYHHKYTVPGLGSRMYTWTVRWTRRRHDGPEVYPYNGAIGVREDDLRSADGNSDHHPTASSDDDSTDSSDDDSTDSSDDDSIASSDHHSTASGSH